VCTAFKRLEAWRRLGSDLDPGNLATINKELGLTDVLPIASKLLNGEVRSRVVVDDYR